MHQEQAANSKTLIETLRLNLEKQIKSEKKPNDNEINELKK